MTDSRPFTPEQEARIRELIAAAFEDEAAKKSAWSADFLTARKARSLEEVEVWLSRWGSAADSPAAPTQKICERRHDCPHGPCS